MLYLCVCLSASDSEEIYSEIPTTFQPTQQAEEELYGNPDEELYGNADIVSQVNGTTPGKPSLPSKKLPSLSSSDSQSDSCTVNMLEVS